MRRISARREISAVGEFEAGGVGGPAQMWVRPGNLPLAGFCVFSFFLLKSADCKATSKQQNSRGSFYRFL